MEKLGIEDFRSMPTYFTLARLIVTPLIYFSAKKNPRRAWKWGIAFAATDKVDGWLARLEDTKEGSWVHRITGWTGEDFHRHGYKRTEGGRMLDPAADLIFGSAVLMASYENGPIPRNMIRAQLLQKVSKSALTLFATSQGVRLEVGNTGRYGEAATATGNGLFYVAESVDKLAAKEGVRNFALALASTGLALATKAEIGYLNDYRQARQSILPQVEDFNVPVE